jgi:RES domain
MIAFRQCDARCPFLWEGAAQPEGRWHAAGEGPAHYFADTPDGAWADFLRHEEIRDPADLATIRRAIWAVDIGDAPGVRPDLPVQTMQGDRSTWPACQAAARQLRATGQRRLKAPSAALMSDRNSDPNSEGNSNGNGNIVVLYGEPAELKLSGWIAAVDASPPRTLLTRVRHYDPRPGA